jgi:hypothetical protein
MAEVFALDNLVGAFCPKPYCVKLWGQVKCVLGHSAGPRGQMRDLALRHFLHIWNMGLSG